MLLVLLGDLCLVLNKMSSPELHTIGTPTFKVLIIVIYLISTLNPGVIFVSTKLYCGYMLQQQHTLDSTLKMEWYFKKFLTRFIGSQNVLYRRLMILVCGTSLLKKINYNVLETMLRSDNLKNNTNAHP